MPVLELTDEEYRQMQRVYERLDVYRDQLLSPVPPEYLILLPSTQEQYLTAFGRMLLQTTTVKEVLEKLNT